MTSYQLYEKVPNFQITNAAGNPSTIDKEMGENGLLVFVLRGTWCVFCVHQIITTRLRYAKYRQREINAVFVAPQDKQSVDEFLADLNASLPFGLHADPYRIVTNLLTNHGAHLGISLLAPNREIEWQYVGEGDDYPTFRMVTEALDQYLSNRKSLEQAAS